jgi:hypothetical protein
MQEQTVINSPVTKIISGAQTGIDRLGLEVGKELGIETGGTTTPGYYTENGIDLSIKDFGVVEISPELQQGKRGKEFYLPRTEQNVINSDGTAYFATNDDSAGRYATERFAKNHNKPFILNPNGEQLRQWLIDNNIQILNVAGNRGSKVTEEFYSEVRNTLKQALQIREKVPTYTNTQALSIMELYDLGERRIREELSTLELTKEEMQTYLNEFAEMMREENVTTREQVEGVVNKFICQL